MRSPTIKGYDFDIQMEDHILRVRKLILAEPKNTARPMLVFLHEALGCIELWRDFPEALAIAAGCDVLLYDRRGCGKSSPLVDKRSLSYLEEEAFIALPKVLKKNAVENPILIGHSDGGTIALLYATKFPQAVRGLITEAAHIFVEDITLTGIRKAIEAYQTTSLKERLQKYHGENTENIFRAWHETWLHPDFRNWNLEKFLSHITCPLLVIQGVDDEYGTPAQVEAIVRRVSGPAKPLLISGCGHTPHHQARETVLLHMRDFIMSLLH